MKLCFIGSADSPHVVRWIKYFVDKGHEISLITLSGVTKLPFEGVQIINLESHDFMNPKNIIKVLILIKKLKKIVSELNPDLIHAHQISSLAYIVPFIKFHPYALSAWGSDVLTRPYNVSNKSYRSRVFSILASNTIKHADLLHCDGVKTWNAFEKLGGSSDKIVIVYFGIDTNNFCPEKRSIEFRKKMGVGKSPVIISTRKLEPLYNITTLIRAIPTVIEEIPDAQFVIGSFGYLREEIDGLAKSLQVSDNTIFTGKISYADFPYYVASSDIYVSTSLSDAGLASSTGEAMACGLPVIVTEDPDNRDWIADGVNGFVIPVKNPEILAKRIVKLIKNERMRKEFGKINREIITERNDYDTEMSKMELEYQKLIKMNY